MCKKDLCISLYGNLILKEDTCKKYLTSQWYSCWSVQGEGYRCLQFNLWCIQKKWFYFAWIAPDIHGQTHDKIRIVNAN